MREGRRLARAGNHDSALARFEVVLGIVPDHASALCEAGWAAFRAVDLTRAQSLLERGVQAAREPNRRAACLYNLGRVYEEHGAPILALSRYHESLALRPNPTVQARIDALAATTPTEVPSRLIEPDQCGVEESAVSTAALCELRRLPEDEWGRHLSCADEVSPIELAFPPRPGATFALVDDRYELYGMTYTLLTVRDQDRWSIVAELGETESHQYDNIGTSTELVRAVARQSSTGTDLVLTVLRNDYDTSSSMDAMYECEERGLAYEEDECVALIEAAEDYDETRELWLACRPDRSATGSAGWWCGWFGSEPPPAEVDRRFASSRCRLEP